MRLINWFFGREKKEEKRTVLKVSELSVFLQDLEKEGGLYGKAQPILEEIVYLIEGVKDNIQAIDSSEDLKDSPKRLVSILKTSKPAFIKAMLGSTEGLDKVPKEKDIKGYQRKLGDFLDSAPKLIIGQGKYLHYSYGEKLGVIKKDLKFLLEKKKELDELLREDAYHEVEADIKSLEESISRKQALEADYGTHKKSFDEKIAAEKELRERYDSIEETESFRVYAENKKKIEETVKERERLENEIYNLLTPIKKTLKAINHTLEKDQSLNISRKDLTAYAENPVEEFMSKDIKETKQFFSHVKETIENDAINLGGDKHRRIIPKIDEILLPEKEKTKLKLIQLIEEEKQQTNVLNQSSYLNIIADLERDLDKTARELHQSRDEHRKIARKISQTSDEITSHKNKLEDSIGKIKGEKVLLDL